MKAQILINRGGGSVGEVSAIRAALDAAGIAGEIRLLDGHELHDAAKEAVTKRVGLVVAGGGDGTISCVAGALAGTGTKLGILPLGTLNHFARDVGLPLDLGEAAAVVANGKPRAVDVAEVNGRLFVNNSAIGLYPLMVLDRDAQQRRLGRSKRLAMIVASFRTLLRFHHRRLTLTVNEEPAGRVDTPLLFVGNNDYRVDIGAPGRRESLDDGELCVFVLRKKTAKGLIAATVRALFNRSRDDDMVRIDGVERLRVSSKRSHLAVSLDGETAMMETPLDYRIRPKALKVVAP
ncbi:MAG TPA: diacylglycerol kinase family protein [Sphingomicrobium sp.]|nr:diacylglycerol kinase family protein [Sphingomicrobium sp.]